MWFISMLQDWKGSLSTDTALCVVIVFCFVFFPSPSLFGHSSFACWSEWQILLWNLMKFEIEFEATIILSVLAVTGMMVPSKPNYRNGDPCKCSEPQGTTKSSMNPQLHCVIYADVLEGCEAKPDSQQHSLWYVINSVWSFKSENLMPTEFVLLEFQNCELFFLFHCRISICWKNHLLMEQILFQ